MKTFESLDFWLKELSDKVNNDNMQLILGGNKCDLENEEIPTNKAKEFAQENNMTFFETLTKTGQGVK
jgi:GTPase SAR1 family protein